MHSTKMILLEEKKAFSWLTGMSSADEGREISASFGFHSECLLPILGEF